MKITRRDFGLGTNLIILESAAGQKLSLSNLGARIVGWETSDGRDIVLGFESAEEYLAKDAYPGATIGRVAGRIRDGKIKVSGRTYETVQNEGTKTLHGGSDSFERAIWFTEVFDKDCCVSITFSHISNAGESGFPGKLKVEVTYTFKEDGTLKIHTTATADADTAFNPTNHIYVNLSGHVDQPIDAHELQLAASQIVDLDSEGLPTGHLSTLMGTALDFHEAHQLKAAFTSDHAAVKVVGGIDHPFVLDERTLEKEQARLTLGKTSFSVFTDQPALVLFTANFGDVGPFARTGKLVNHGAITFEAQVVPEAEAFGWGSITLKKDGQFSATTIFKLKEN